MGDRLHSLLCRHDALLAPRRGAGIRLDFDHPPAPGDTVLVADADDMYLMRFDEVVRPWGSVRIIAVVRTR